MSGEGALNPYFHCVTSFIFVQGTATREDIDTTLKLGMNHPMGPLQLADLYVLLNTQFNFNPLLMLYLN